MKNSRYHNWSWFNCALFSPYSPELNPIENVFPKLKLSLRAYDSVYLSTHSPCTVVLMAFCTITKDDYINYMRHSGYMY